MHRVFIFLLFISFYHLQAELLKEFDANGLVKSERNYIKKVLREERFYLNGKKHGIFKVYFPSGKVQSESSYKKDKLDGLSNTYFKNGRLKTKEYYIENSEQGTFKKYNKVADLCVISENVCLKILYFF